MEAAETNISSTLRDFSRVGIGMDSAVIPLRQHGLSLVQTVDFFYPLVDDPRLMGRIACANVLSDVYACGVVAIDRIEMILSVATEFTDAERDIVVPLMIDGFKTAASEAGCEARIGIMATNPWCMIGGIATSVCKADEIIIPSEALEGDVLVLTKPLGTQLATNAMLWMNDNTPNWQRLFTAGITCTAVESAANAAIASMCRLNRYGAELMHKYNAHAATDVTGFGLFGHASNLASFQRDQRLQFIITRLPIFRNVREMALVLGQTKLLQGRAVETSGGLLIAINAMEAKSFCDEHAILTGCEAWIIGSVVRRELIDEKNVRISDCLEFLDV